jgi:GNAT superfamily N-acetyltransferase
VAHVIRELAENPNVHVPLSGGRELVLDPGGRFGLYLHPGRAVHDATVQRVRCAPDAVEALLGEVRRLLHDRGRRGAEWELGESTEPADLVDRLIALGLRRDEGEPVATGMALRGAPHWDVPSAVVARRVASVDELVAARKVQIEAFGDGRDLDETQVERDYEREGVEGSTFVALVDGEIVGAAHASYTPWGLVLFGGAVLERARGRGAYRALVAARAREAAGRGTPVLVVHAGRMSRPILERLGFEPVSRIDRLVDVLA